ncbi:hypothetical protein ACOME3_000040 [Neoechinorhynchus agilis]
MRNFSFGAGRCTKRAYGSFGRRVEDAKTGKHLLNYGERKHAFSGSIICSYTVLGSVKSPPIPSGESGVFPAKGGNKLFSDFAEPLLSVSRARDIVFILR